MNAPQRPPQPRRKGFTAGQLVIAPDGREGVVVDIFTDNTVSVAFWNVPLHRALTLDDADVKNFPMDAVEILKEAWDQ